ncbi:Rib3 3,4-Dihydroxy-2-butanone 4-phosphate synthase [Candida orthopsilosis Co 90-125]|uniref:3,4-dihydroxy-2-butanone 4-phosphate synthase n=1 Tax=Candida orthopsilosis (strain 90-125) TaxID=1136231 RepID=H8X9W2_CANO9|nr:Rib3 3,4-Dihydroxy-2-butanone 4-phosphate synthase [Candida orthopsilosis Co 90-125]CCG24779.1 Rib3 3,4-Dihydroxy-2-butanone 4-phosphate synthase [Candida orthopsilosis Co 90-125]
MINMTQVFTPIEDALAAFKKGEFLVVMDDEDRENEGDLIMSAELITQEQMAFLVRHSSGYVCVPLSTERADKLDLRPMIQHQTDRHGTAYTVTCDYAEGTTTGISAHDRALTARSLANKDSKPDDFIKPGHIVPLRAVPGLLNKRRGHTEAAVQLCELTGLQPAAVICELVRDEDGLMMRLDDCVKFSQEYNIKIININQLVDYISK